MDEGKFDDLVVAYRKQVETELSDVCLDVLDLLENSLVKNNTKENEARVFYLKMTGDYYRYLAEFVTDKNYEQKAADFYKQAQEISTKVLDATHPIRLGLALNYSVCFYEILKDKKAACELAKSPHTQTHTHMSTVGHALTRRTAVKPRRALFPFAHPLTVSFVAATRTPCAWRLVVCFHQVCVRSGHLWFGQAARGELQGLYAHHAAAEGQPHTVDIRVQPGR